MYRHFQNREALFRAVALRGLETLAGYQQRALDACREDDALGRLYAACSAYLHFAADHPGFYNLLFDYTMPGILEAPEIQAAQKSSQRTAVAQIVACQERGLIHEIDPNLLATALWTCAHGVSQLRLADTLNSFLDDDSDPDLLAETILAMVLDRFRLDRPL